MASMAFTSFVGLAALVSAASDKNTEAAYWVAIAGNVASLFLFAAPLRTFRRIRSDGSVGEVSPYPYIVGLFNCGIWLLYAHVLENSDPVTWINFIGLAVLRGRIPNLLGLVSAGAQLCVYIKLKA